MEEKEKEKKKRHEGKRHFVLTEPLIQMRRHYGKLIKQKNPFGHFYGVNAYEAARKASQSIYESYILTGHLFDPDYKITFQLREITKDSDRKIYSYRVQRIYLEEPIVVKMKDGREYQISFEHKIEAIHL